VYTNLHLNFHTLYKIPNNNICIYDGNPNHIAIKHISFQIHKSPSVVYYDWGFCCCSGQLVSENFAKLPNTKCSIECSIVWQSRLRRHTTSMKSEVAYHHYGEVECTLSTVSKRRGKTRFSTRHRYPVVFFQATGGEWIPQYQRRPGLLPSDKIKKTCV